MRLIKSLLGVATATLTAFSLSSSVVEAVQILPSSVSTSFSSTPLVASTPSSSRRQNSVVGRKHRHQHHKRRHFLNRNRHRHQYSVHSLLQKDRMSRAHITGHPSRKLVQLREKARVRRDAYHANHHSAGAIAHAPSWGVPTRNSTHLIQSAPVKRAAAAASRYSGDSSTAACEDLNTDVELLWLQDASPSFKTFAENLEPHFEWSMENIEASFGSLLVSVGAFSNKGKAQEDCLAIKSPLSADFAAAAKTIKEISYTSDTPQRNPLEAIFIAGLPWSDVEWSDGDHVQRVMVVVTDKSAHEEGDLLDKPAFTGAEDSCIEEDYPDVPTVAEALRDAEAVPVFVLPVTVDDDTLFYYEDLIDRMAVGGRIVFADTEDAEFAAEEISFGVHEFVCSRIHDDGEGSNVGLIVGCAFGGVALLAGGGYLGWYFYKKRQENDSELTQSYSGHFGPGRGESLMENEYTAGGRRKA